MEDQAFENQSELLGRSFEDGGVSLAHRPGSSLWADGLTKSLPAQSLEKFCRGVLLCRDHEFMKHGEPHTVPMRMV